MNFSDESYVRLYTRDTTSWLRLGWDGQCIVSLMLRKLDRAGTLDLDGLEPWEAVMLQLNCPEETARKGIASALRVGVFVVVEGRLVAPNYIEAQTCSKSDRLRQQESRAKRANGDDPRRTPPTGQDVTIRDSESQEVTTGHEKEDPVTFGHSLLSSAVPSFALREGERGREARLVVVPEPPEAPADPLDAFAADFAECRRAVRVGFSRRWEAAKQPGMWTESGSVAVDSLARWLQSLEGNRQVALDRTLDTFFADEWVRSKHFDVEHLAKHKLKYFEPRAAPSGPASANGRDTVASVRAEMGRAAAAQNYDLAEQLKRKLDALERQLPENQPKWGNHGR